MIDTTNLFSETNLFESLVASLRITQSYSRRSGKTVEIEFINAFTALKLYQYLII
jgi:hypothetical protein